MNNENNDPQPSPTPTPIQSGPAPATSPTPTPTPTAAPTGHTTNGMAIASLIVGIVGFLTSAFIVGTLFGIIAIILGIIGLKKPGGKGLSIAGIITGTIGFLSGLAFTIIWVLALIGGGGALSELSDQIKQYDAEQQAIMDAKKDFAKGETAVFGAFEVTATKVERNYQPQNEFYAAGEGEELVAVTLSVKNTSDSVQTVSAYDFAIVEDGVGTSATLSDAEPAFEGGDLQASATVTGILVFTVTKDAKNLNLGYSTYAGTEEVLYTLAI